MPWRATLFSLRWCWKQHESRNEESCRAAKQSSLVLHDLTRKMRISLLDLPLNNALALITLDFKSSLPEFHQFITLSAHCSKSSFFVQKFNFDFPSKLSIFWVKNAWKYCGFGLFSYWQLWFHEKNCQKKIWLKNSWKYWGFVKIEFLDKNLTFRIVCLVWPRMFYATRVITAFGT